MKFALVNGQRQEAGPNLLGRCPACDHAMVAKCGEVRIWHWAHQGRRVCDPWWENETEWHRAWKGQFPDSWQEVVHTAEDGTRHIADLRTQRGWVIEFQHSYIRPDERRARQAFYAKLIWVVHGTRRKRDAKQLSMALNEGALIFANLPVWRVSSDGCALLRDWAGSDAPVFFDFGDQRLWWLIASRPDGQTFVGRYARSDFIEVHRGAITQVAPNFDEYVQNLIGLITDYEAHARAQALRAAVPQPLPGFQQYLARQNSRRRRF